MVEAVQFDLIREHGGMPGLRDEHGLESALARPRQHHAYQPASSLAELAADYGHALAGGHPFHDGNKRIAFMAMAIFLGLKGREIEAPETEVVSVMVALAAADLDEKGLAAWLESRTIDRPPRQP